MNKLGLELVSRKETALSELIKNAYDADATEVSVTFKKVPDQPSELIISDNGSGMRREDIINGYLRISTNAKEEQPYSPLKHRMRAGRKGIGRFSAQRLAHVLVLESETHGRDRYRIKIEWNRFEQNREISDITFNLERLEPQGQSGTLLRLVNLRDEWSDSDIDLAYAYTAEILEPAFFEVTPQDFVVRVVRFDGKAVRPIIEDPTPFRQFAVAEVTGQVRRDGTAIWSVDAPKIGLNSKQNLVRDTSKQQRVRQFKHLPELSFRAFYFIKKAEFVPGRMRSQLNGYLANHGGIRVYRNGFRVLPYGETRDDWLSLDQVTKARVILYPLSNDNWLGAVTISDLEGEYFQETSSREGLIHNDSFNELRDVLSASLVGAAEKVNSRRGKKILAGQRVTEIQPHVRRQVRSLKDDLRALANPDAYKSAYVDNVQTAKLAVRNLNKIERAYATMTRQLIQENALLRILASIGLTVGEFTHEVRLLIAQIKGATTSLRRKARKPTEVVTLSEKLQKHANALGGYVGYFDRLTSANYSREQRPIDVIKAVYEFKSSASPVLMRSDISIDVEVTTKSAISPPMHESEWSSILLNFMTNSIKAIDRSGHGEGRILIRVGASDNLITVDFEDNGDGVPADARDKIFDAFYTTSSFDRSRDAIEQNLGTGLGLKIVRDTVTAVGGRAFVSAPTEGFVTSMRVEVPRGG